MLIRRLALVAVLAALIAAFFIFDLDRFLSLAYFETQRDAMLAYTRAHPVLVSAVYFVVYVLVVAVSLPGGAVMTLIGGALFGLVGGTVLVSFASSIGSTAAFLVSRFLLQDWVQERFGRQLRAVNRGVERDGAFYLFALRLVPVFPLFVINLVMGVVPISTLRFYVVSQLGMLPGTIVYVFAGTQLGRVDSIGEVLSFEMILAFTLLGLFPLIARQLTGWLQARRALAGFRRPRRFDDNLIVIGAGSAGLIASLIAATVKARVTLVERDRMGGDCLNTGCVPSKTLLASAKTAQTVRKSHRFGVRSGPTDVDFASVMRRVAEAIRTIEPNDSVERYTELGVNCMPGTARLVDPWTVEVDGVRRTARAIVIASGARPAVPPIPGLDAVAYVTSDSVWSLDARPRRLVVLGGGPIGCELAQGFARLGSDVTLVDVSERVLAKEDPEVSALLGERLQSEGVSLLTGHRASRVRPERADGGAQDASDRPAGEGRSAAGVLEAATDDGIETIAFDRLLVAVGRQPNFESLGLEALGVRTRDGGGVETDRFMRTRVPSIFACGDVAGPWQFTHMASHQAWYAAVNALFGRFRRFAVNDSVVPWTTYTDPEVAHVGLNEMQAHAEDVRYEVTRFEFADLDRAIAENEREGFIKVLTAPGKDRILGATIIGPRAGDLIAEYVLAMTHGIGLKQLMGTIHVYPTFAEINKFAASSWRKAHAPGANALTWLERFHAWQR